ncbi:sugar ABC transporter ATP-binding protein [Fodinisporobacter ferrooxydans]|uniref:Sugar ABC transporter ATP-binding protein n=1 Tax=Fodinisporobacter ferrooxydans TaxID=2901836 RepID=A0ABY4CKM7_9BACL|nr:sugar ABC transporter ATP-binding protein [Alicyclobacillaceae bacterium MYW30-H2]
MPFFDCKHIVKTYGSVVAIRDASLSLEKGEIRAILGGNGSGKSTLAKIIGGAVKPNSGELFLVGEPYKVHSPAQAKKKRVVITSQELSLLMNLTVEENLVLPSIPKKMGLWTNRKEMEKRAAKVLEQIGLTDRAKTLAGDLPANEQFMVEFAKSLLQDPQILIVDEITSALYREEVEIFKRIVRELSDQGCSILFISHRMNEIFSLCSTVTVMRNGLVIGTYDIKDVDEETLLSLLTGPKEKSNVEIPDMEEQVTSNNVLLSVNGMQLKRFGSSINLNVYQGEVIGIAGLQGQGQSDFVRTLFGLTGPVDIELDGKPIHLSSGRKSVKEGLAFLSGDREREGTFAGRSISENLAAVNEGALGRPSLNEEELLKEYGVKYDTPAQPIKNLSGGNQQKVVLARWTGSKPKVLLADDPTKGIDVPARRDVHEVFKKLAAVGSAVIMVSSDDEELVNLARMVKNSRILVMYHGQFVRELKGEEMTVHNIIAASLPREGVETH